MPNAIYDNSVVASDDVLCSDVPDPPDDTFQIIDAETANWVVKRIMTARAYADRCKVWADAEIRRAEREEEFFWTRFGHQLRSWTAAEIERQKSKRKSVSLPAGMVGFRTVAPRLVVTNDIALLNWAKRCLPESVKIVESVQKSALNEHFDTTGEVPSGLQIEPAGEKFYVR